MAKKASTYTIDVEVRKEFKAQTSLDGLDMSDVVEQMMINYTATSRKLHSQRLFKEQNDGS